MLHSTLAGFAPHCRIIYAGNKELIKTYYFNPLKAKSVCFI